MGTTKLSPSEFMRQRRPENYSDSQQRTAYELDTAILDHHLETITSRNQTHDFEIFCRKLCERSICPNLRPQTGPDGGGDSKADSETVPVGLFPRRTNDGQLYVSVPHGSDAIALTLASALGIPGPANDAES